MKRLAFLLFLASLLVAETAAQTVPSPPPVDSAPTVNVQQTASTASLETTKNIVQIFFWIVIAAIAILTYLRARKSLLQPLRTEVFKLQLEEMKSLLGLFVGKGEVVLRKDHAFSEALHVNSVSMYDSYAATFFDHHVDATDRPYSPFKCPNAVITSDGLKNFQLATEHAQSDRPTQTKQNSDPRVRAALWADYDCHMLHVPPDFASMEKQLTDLLENPLLPKRCVGLIEEYSEVVRVNLMAIRNTLLDAAKEMPQKYPTLDTLNSGSLSWIQHSYNRHFTDLKPHADKIVEFIRNEYDIENLFRG